MLILLIQEIRNYKCATAFHENFSPGPEVTVTWPCIYYKLAVPYKITK
jgi:hypothetical protein